MTTEKLTLSALLAQHGAAAVWAMLQGAADHKLYGPWEQTNYRSIRWRAGEPMSRIEVYFRPGDRNWTHDLASADKTYPTREAAQSACDAALREAGAVLVENS
jgi:hypothetical protein